MAVVGFFHHIGTFLILVAVALLIVTTISAPVVHDISILRVNMRNSDQSISFGTFGYCVLDADGNGNDRCTGSHVGYQPADILGEQLRVDFSDAARRTANGLTKTMVLHPIATGVSFISFALTLGAGVVGSFLASVVAVISFVITCAALVCDFVLFSIVKHHVSDANDNAGGPNGNGRASASYSVAMWTILVAAILELLAAIVIFFSCCSARMHRQRTARTSKHAVPADDYGTAVAPRRRRRWF
ncbi:uncharacterized protein E0L32_000022 [Thyridium curvatum]|uniref:Pali-domain-containing protein n=1 Tax=Thyridium curvatum TaxID=1093900 RepID=A0A507BG57_9PEZI|nr:uncharacterized protein E0L32_000022 [Thyridium curvatum]TPX15688.1 hypothetical protein E0L32_000022 [Thyridium curvatum]